MEIFVVIIVILVYFIPTWLASGKSHSSSVFLLNLLLGWTIIGWIVAFIWGAMEEPKPNTTIVNQINDLDDISKLEKLSKLRSEGALTEDEFQKQKAKILKNNKI